MNIKTESLSLTSAYLSEIELYFSDKIENDTVIISGDESNHLVKVMRHSVDDEVWVTDGMGKIFQCVLSQLEKNSSEAKIIKTVTYPDEFSNCTVCIPHLKNTDRLEFALEKCTELGITQFIVYNSERTINRSAKLERWNKIVLAAMKQSLRSYLPVIKSYTLQEISRLSGNKILFDQSSYVRFSKKVISLSELNYLIIGPEGGLSKPEAEFFHTSAAYKLAPNRLRSETAAIICASLLFD